MTYISLIWSVNPDSWLLTYTHSHDNIIIKKLFIYMIFRIEQTIISIFVFSTSQAFPGGSDHKESAYNLEDPSLILGKEDPLENEMATHSSILAWKIPRTEKSGGLQSKGSQKSWTQLSSHTYYHIQGSIPADARWPTDVLVRALAHGCCKCSHVNISSLDGFDHPTGSNTLKIHSTRVSQFLLGKLASSCNPF